ncbi:MAG: hypothetical protein CMJ78_03180 [Planctomycetaceae bacterium]|nr:hypothetical protein [Planctomycetaceae bacterium]
MSHEAEKTQPWLAETFRRASLLAAILAYMSGSRSNLNFDLLNLISKVDRIDFTVPFLVVK